MSVHQKSRVDDDDLDDLDDVLDQFSPPAQQQQSSSSPKAPPAPAKPSAQPESSGDAELETQFSKEMEALFKELGIGPRREGSEGAGGGDPEQQRQFAAAWEAMLVEGMNGVTDTSAEDAPSPPPKGDDFQSKIHSTMNKLRESESGLQASDSTASGGDALESLLSQLGGLDGDAQNEEDLQGMLETMMGQLMSKEVLHEPLKELYEKFPDYLDKNKSEISLEDKKRFEEQISCIKRLLDEFEAETYQDDDETSREKIVALMTELQAHGSPPEEIMGPLPPGFSMGNDGLPNMPEGCNQILFDIEHMPTRASTSDGDEGDNNARRRQPFRPLQPFRMSRSPSRPTKSIDINTPPREIILTPRATPKPVKRKASSRLKRTVTKVKNEPPEIHISRVRPPSPTDDPLLLLGTPPIGSPPLRARLTPNFSSSPDARDAGPSLSFTSRLFHSGRRSNEFGSAGSSDASDMGHALPNIFGVPRTIAETSGAWSDSDDDGLNLEGEFTGEFTGRYTLLKVRTKVDPPPRVTSWGRPVSPFPYSEIMERSFAEGGEDVQEAMDVGEDVDAWEVATEPPLSETEASPPPSVSEDEFAALDEDFLPLFDLDAESTVVRPLVEPREECPNSDRTSLEEEEEEEEAQIYRELSVMVDDDPNTHLDSTEVVPVMEDGSSDVEDDVEGEDIIKITSDDPKAAARAAAILKLHDYDCILAAEKKKQSKRSSKATRQRRKTVENAGITKSYIDLKNPRWKPLQGSEASPGSRSLPLLELWRDAEDSVFLEHHSMSYYDPSFTLSPLKTVTTPPEPLLPPPTGEWTRDCWKHLDKCLAAERLAVAASRGLGSDVLADVAEISKDAVLDRFAEQLGGASVLLGLGTDWSRSRLMLRLDVLVKKQARRATRTPTTARQDTIQPQTRYGGLLQEAMALSGTPEGCVTSASTTFLSDTLKTMRLFPDLSLSGWQTSDIRDPVRTPSRTPDPRPMHPKDKVHLRHASVPPKSRIPIRPKRLVDLRHLSPIKADRTGRSARRSSGCSVKDLVKQFERLDKFE